MKSGVLRPFGTESIEEVLSTSRLAHDRVAEAHITGGNRWRPFTSCCCLYTILWLIRFSKELQVFQNDRDKLIVYRTFEGTPSFKECDAPGASRSRSIGCRPVRARHEWMEVITGTRWSADHTSELASSAESVGR